MVIQRSWKILSDSASTANNNTISSDVQQRSPAALQANSSSDDSDCSNQTTHSMDTRVASPLKQTETEATTETTTLIINGTEPALVCSLNYFCIEYYLKFHLHSFTEICNHLRHGREHAATHSATLQRRSQHGERW